MVTQFVGISEMSHRRGRKLMTVVVVARVAVSRGAASQARKGDGARGEWRRERDSDTCPVVGRSKGKEERKKKAAGNRCRFIVVN